MQKKKKKILDTRQTLPLRVFGQLIDFAYVIQNQCSRHIQKP